MFRKCSLSLLVLALGSLAASPPAVTHELKLRELSQGDVVVIERTDVDEITLTTFDAGGKPLDQKKQQQTTTLVYWERIVEKPPRAVRATRLQRGYGSAKIKSGGETRTLGLEGKVVVIERRKDRYHFFVDKKELAGAEAEFLDKEFNRPGADHPFHYEMILPKQAVEVGASWPIDTRTWTASIAAGTGLSFDADKAKSSGTLHKVFPHNEKSYGSLSFELEAPITSYRKGDQLLPVKPGGKNRVSVALEVCIDGSESFGTLRLDSTTHFHALVDAGGDKQYTLSVHARNRRDQTVKPHNSK